MRYAFLIEITFLTFYDLTLESHRERNRNLLRMNIKTYMARFESISKFIIYSHGNDEQKQLFRCVCCFIADNYKLEMEFWLFDFTGVLSNKF